jgi:hypothetical protein
MYIRSENDQPFSKQWQQHSFSGFEDGSFEIAGTAVLSGAVERIRRKWPECGAIGKVSYANGT